MMHAQHYEFKLSARCISHTEILGIQNAMLQIKTIYDMTLVLTDRPLLKLIVIFKIKFPQYILYVFYPFLGKPSSKPVVIYDH